MNENDEIFMTTLARIVGRARARGDQDMLTLAGLMGVLKTQMSMNSYTQLLNQQTVAREVVAKVGKVIRVENLKDGDRVTHGCDTESILISARNLQGYPDYNVMGRPDGPDGLVVSVPLGEIFTGDLIIDIYNA